jgi:flagellar hook protein FlgE
MLRSLYSGVSGMRSFQTKMDVISNNIANVNTTAFKSGRAKFQDMLSQTTANAQSPTEGGLGGVNPQQIGLGVKVGSIDTIMTGGPLQPTNRNLDFAVEGEGFFVLSDGVGNDVYTRDGAFYTDYNGNLINSSGLKVQGYINESPDEIDWEKEDDDTLDALQIPLKVDSGGEFDEDGDYELQEFSIDGTGKIKGVYSKIDDSSDGESKTFVFGQVGMAKFNNPEGLEKTGNNNYVNSNNSGEPVEGVAGEAGYGVIRQGFLEMSNVDLANEFTEMIVTSRAYQANSRSITTSDEMIQELINLKR